MSSPSSSVLNGSSDGQGLLYARKVTVELNGYYKLAEAAYEDLQVYKVSFSMNLAIPKSMVSTYYDRDAFGHSFYFTEITRVAAKIYI